MTDRARTDPSPARNALSRRRLLGGAALTSAALTSAALATGLPSPASAARSCCPVRNEAPAALLSATAGDLARGNAQAQAVARRSRLIMRTLEGVRDVARSLPDATIRARTIALLENPAPTYQLRYPTPADREALRRDLLDAGLIPATTTVAGIFPPVADANEAPQPFWSAPGSGYSAHHAYPGGLAVHELVFAHTTVRYRETYDTFYDLADVPGAVDEGFMLGVSLWHDVHKVTVMQWLEDGSELAEQTIADTGAHHTLSGAEAIVRGMSPAWITAQMSAHDAPTNVQTLPGQTGRQRLVNYLRAAAMIAGVDPVAFGVLRRAAGGGFVLAQDPPRIEDYVIHFADQDYVFTNDAVQRLVAELTGVAAGYGIDAQREPARFNLFRNLVFSQLSEVRLYGAFQQGGVAGMRATIDAEVDLSQLAERA